MLPPTGTHLRTVADEQITVLARVLEGCADEIDRAAAVMKNGR